MQRLYKFFSCLSILLIGLIFFVTAVNAGADVKKPIIVSINQNGAHISRPLITGLTSANTEVLIYVDGEYDGNAQINIEQTGTDNFYYQIKQELREGTHTVSALAKDKTSLRLSEFSLFETFTIKSLPAPTLIEPDENTVTGKVKPVITGLTVNNTFVHIFVDGRHNGKTEILKHLSGTANFSYKPFLNLTTGWHTVWARAEDASGRVSSASKVLRFYIESPLPAPIVIKVDPRGSKYNRPFITGLSKNNTKIRIFIDRQLNGEFLVANHPSGTANFSYLPFLELRPGRHIIYATALDTRGKESLWSNIVYYNVIGARLAVKDILEEPADAEAMEDKDEISIIDLGEKINDIGEKAIDSGSATVSPDLKDILNFDRSTGTEEGGLMDESQEQQAKLKLNLIIFIIFLFAVIGWIFWVNRELIKEKREQNKQDKK
ncbi:hypothetical protein KAU09_02765 [Candidatus Parcubacteria bacterium]|nr:hypothetical protein [Candidatus Parcubacteria bacterium]